MTCTIYYNHKTATLPLWQIFTGFFELQSRGIITVKLKLHDWLPESYTNSLLLVDVDNRYTAIYDVNDGYDWLFGDIEPNLQYFKETLSAQSDFYFKRSYHDELLQYTTRSKVFPLGLNYPVTSPANKMFNVHFDLKSRITHQIRSIEWARKLLKIDGRKHYNINNFEYVPFTQNKVPKILFLARLWDPYDTKNIHPDKLGDEAFVIRARERIMQMNEVRATCIAECRKLFGSQFTGGLEHNDFTLKRYPDLVVPYAVFNKGSYLDQVKASDICITTTGINRSIGFKMGEYVAAARGIITEKMHFMLPGNFSSPRNYLEFTDVPQLVANITTLMDNPGQLHEMMLNNYQYYNVYLRPDNLILNTLLTMKAQAG